jgi:hypothetical protein
MSSLDFNRWALSIAATAMLAGCGVLPLSLSKGQDDMQQPIGAPGATPQSHTIARAWWNLGIVCRTGQTTQTLRSGTVWKSATTRISALDARTPLRSGVPVFRDLCSSAQRQRQPSL